MQKWFLKILVCAVNVFILAYILPGIEIQDMFTALLVAVILSFLDAIIKPLLILLTLPATILTLGLFLFVINACIILIDDHFVGGFKVESFWHALLFSVLLSFFNSFVHKKAFPERKTPDTDR
ncbi:MAG TPA: phage holin family protein [Ferruginibacter sp.]|nr:phage holin family protein [Ferruginibacter sp.]